MKALLFIALLITATSCAQTQVTVLSYSGDFKLALPNSKLASATIFSIDELSVKTAEGQLISGGIISAESEGFKGPFETSDYPDFVFRLKPPVPGYDGVFDTSSAELDFSYGLSNLEVLDLAGRKIYHVCKNDRCLAYVVKAAVIDHILTLHSVGLTREKFVALLKEV